jgi:molybdopterin-guanine dinucleotide biosynthesis protein A
VVVRTDDQRRAYERLLGERVGFASDAPGFDGPLAGLVGAAGATDARWLACCGCDMPLLDPAAVGWLVDLLDGPAGAADAVAVEHPDGTVEPLHTLYRRERVVAARERLPRAAGPRALLAGLDVHVVPVAAVPADVPMARSTTSVDTRADLAAARADDE